MSRQAGVVTAAARSRAGRARRRPRSPPGRRSAGPSPVIQGARLRPSTPGAGTGRPRRSRIVGATSACWACRCTTLPLAIPGTRTIRGTSSISACRVLPCSQPPCSRNSSPWSETKTITVSSQQPAPAEEVEQLAEGRVVGGDLGVVEVQQVPEHLRRGRDLPLLDPAQEVHPGEALVLHAGGEALPEGERGSVGGVRLHGVEIEEEGRVPLPSRSQPAGGRGVDVGRRAVLPRQQLVGLEPLAEAEAARHVAVGDEPRGAVPLLPQPLGQGDGLPGEDVPPAVDAVGAGQQAGEEGGGGGAGPGGLGHGVPEEGRLAGEGVDARRDRPRVAVAAEVVRPQGVHEIEDDVARPALGGWPAGGAAGAAVAWRGRRCQPAVAGPARPAVAARGRSPPAPRLSRARR